MTASAIALGYIVFLLGYGVVKGGRAKSFKDFTGSAAQPSLFVITASMCASFIGGGFSLGNAERAFSSGMANTVLLLGFSAGQLLVGVVLAPRFRRFAGDGITTAGGIIGRAAGDGARILCGILSALFCTGVLGAQLNAVGSVAGYIFSLSPKICSLIGFAVILLYSTFGGLKASLKSDALQITVLGIGLPLALAAAIAKTGGLARLFESVPQNRLDLGGQLGTAEFICVFLTFMLGEMLCPPAAQRMLISRDARRTKSGTLLSGAISVPFFVVTGLIGLCALALRTTTIPAFAMPSLISTVLGPVLGAVVCAAMLCVYLSSGGAFLNSCALSLCEDVAQVVAQKSINDRSKLKLARVVNVICACAAFAAAVSFDDVLSILVLSYSFWAPVVLVPIVLALFGKKLGTGVFMTASAAAAGVLIAWRMLGEPFGISPIVAGLAANISAYIFLIKKPEKIKDF